MDSPRDKTPGKRRKILDQAMDVLRETRSRIDPALLALMKEKIGKAGLDGTKPVPPAPTQSVFEGKTVEAWTVKKADPKVGAGKAASLYAAQAARPLNPPPKGPEMEPVDRQKIAAIVMEYMRLREEKKPGH